MLTVAKRTLTEQVGLVPKFALINRINQLDMEDLTVLVHKRVDYNGIIESPIEAIVRIMILQQRAGGELEMGRVPTSEEVFGTYYPSVAAPILPEWIGISDRAYIVRGRQEIDYKHRLSNNLSIHSPTVGGQGVIRNGPLYLCFYGDLDLINGTMLNSIFTRVIGIASTVASHL